MECAYCVTIMLICLNVVWIFVIGIGNIVSGFFIDGICVVPLALAIDVIFYYSCIRMQNITYFVSLIEMNFTQILIIQDCTCKLIHKKCH